MVSVRNMARTKKEKIISMTLIAPFLISFFILFMIPFFLIGQKIPDWYRTLVNILFPVMAVSFGLSFVYSLMLSIKRTSQVVGHKVRHSNRVGYDQRTRSYQYEQRVKYGIEDRCSVYDTSSPANTYVKQDVKVELESPAGTIYDLYLDGKYMGAMSGVTEVSPGFHRVCVKDADDKLIFDEMMNFDDDVSLIVQIKDGISEIDVRFT